MLDSPSSGRVFLINYDLRDKIIVPIFIIIIMIIMITLGTRTRRSLQQKTHTSRCQLYALSYVRDRVPIVQAEDVLEQFESQTRVLHAVQYVVNTAEETIDGAVILDGLAYSVGKFLPVLDRPVTDECREQRTGLGRQ